MEMVLASHLALVNVTLALDASKDSQDPDAKEPPKSVQRRHYREYQKFRDWVAEMRSNPAEYIKTVGYAELFGIEPPEKPKQKTVAERVAEGKAAARRAVRSIAAGLRGE